MNFTYTAQPTGTDIVSLSDMKEFLRVDSTDEDTTITALLDAAVQSIQDYTGLHFKDTTWLYSMQYMRNVVIPYGATTIGGLTYYNTAGGTTSLTNNTDFYWGFENGALKLKIIEMPSNIIDDKMDAVNITGTVVNQINPALTHAVKMLVAHYYENRRAAVVGATTSVMPFGIRSIINPYRLIHLK
tara:strand:+ start:34 stop:591 length:558 start_codon:yes stop_codon:yes gene_type:complete